MGADGTINGPARIPWLGLMHKHQFRATGNDRKGTERERDPSVVGGSERPQQYMW